MGAGKVELQSIPFGIDDVISNLGEMLITLAVEKGLRLYFTVDAALPPKIMGDPERLRQVLTNLVGMLPLPRIMHGRDSHHFYVGNAIKFTERGEIVVTCTLVTSTPPSISKTTTDDIAIRFEVADTGCGISEGDQANLFKPFFQVDTRTTRKYGGTGRANCSFNVTVYECSLIVYWTTGLGLSIARQIVHLFGGQLTVESKLSQGSVFCFTLPTKRVAAHPVQSSSGCHTYIVSSHSTSHRVYGQWFSSQGMIVNCCLPSEAAKALARRNTSCHTTVVVDLDTTDDINTLLATLLPINQVLMIVLINPMQRKPILQASSDVKFIVRPLTAAKLYSYLPSTLHASPLSPQSLSRTKESLEATNTLNDVSFHDLTVLVVEGKKYTCNTEKFLTVLFFTDNPINIKVIVKFLEKMGFTVETANNGIEAVQQFATHNLGYYSLILMDCQMPEVCSAASRYCAISPQSNLVIDGWLPSNKRDP